MQLDELNMSSSSSKRGRDEDEERADPEWTDDEMDVLSSVRAGIRGRHLHHPHLELTYLQTLMHPFRPLPMTYPPGELPPPNAIDELTSQVLAFAFRQSPKRNSHDRPHTSDPPADPELGHGREGWNHSWDATRRKLFELALAESKFGHEVIERKMNRGDGKVSRPGLKRVDSMDFLDEQSEEKTNDNLGRALRWVSALSMGIAPRRVADVRTTSDFRRRCRIARNRMRLLLR